MEFIKSPELKRYLEAVEEIMSGKSVQNLKKITTQCNDNYLKNHSVQECMGYFSTALILSFAIHAENKILQGHYPQEVYGFIFKEEKSEEGRMRCRRILENVVKDYKKVN